MDNLRVWHIVNVPSKPKYHRVSTPEEGADLINKLAGEDLKKYWITSNAFGMEVFENGEWTEWENETGDDILALADERAEEKTNDN